MRQAGRAGNPRGACRGYRPVTRGSPGAVRSAVARWWPTAGARPSSETHWTRRAFRPRCSRSGAWDSSMALRTCARFARAFAEGKVTPAPSLLLRSAMAEARTISDPAGNAKLSKGSQGGRRLRASRRCCGGGDPRGGCRRADSHSGLCPVVGSWWSRESPQGCPGWGFGKTVPRGHGFYPTPRATFRLRRRRLHHPQPAPWRVGCRGKRAPRARLSAPRCFRMAEPAPPPPPAAGTVAGGVSGISFPRGTKLSSVFGPRF